MHATTSLPTVRVDDGLLILDGFVEGDSAVVEYIASAEDADWAVHNSLQVGVRAMSTATSELDVRTVSDAFASMTGAVNDHVERVGHEVGELVERMTAEDGEVPIAIGAFAEQLDDLLGKTFDPDSKQSLIGKLDAVLAEARTQQVEAIRRLVDPGDASSLLGRTRLEIIKAGREDHERLRTMLTELSERIAVKSAQAEMAELTSAKGVAFEDVAHSLIGELVVPLGDLAEQTGREAGANGSYKGDEVVTLSPEALNGRTGRYVIECKASRQSLPSILAELDEAMANREADAAIAVFKRTKHCPTGTAFAFRDNRALIVLDPDEGDTAALRLALMWARWVVQRSVVETVDEIDVSGCEAALEEATRVLTRASTIRRCHSTARKRIEEASGHLDVLVNEVETALDAAYSALRP
jgi:hypothetical protein